MTQIKRIKQSTINRALRLHKTWLCNESGGKRLNVTTEIVGLIDFRGANFSFADFSFASFRNADFYNADFRGANFSFASFRNADFGDTDFDFANFSDASFRNADFLGANFSFADFSFASFRNADFRGANFSFANFNSADFHDVEFSFAKRKNINLSWISTINLKGLTVISCQVNTSDQNRSIQYWKDLDIVTAGCFSGTIDELKDAVEKEHKEKHKDIYVKYLAVFNYIDTILKIESEEENEKTN